jgi:hypothetical protein
MHINQPQSELVFAEYGDDLLVTTTIRANNSPHVMWKGVNVFRGKVVPAGGRLEAAVADHRITLQYCIFQNRDLFTRSFKDVEITWRVHGRLESAATYKVEQAFCPDSAELLELLPKLKALAEHSEPDGSCSPRTRGSLQVGDGR